MTGALPEQMRVIEFDGAGGPEVISFGERKVPTPAEGEVLIKVVGAGINRPDVMQRQGNYPPPEGASDIPGLEVAGKVVAVGSGVERFAVGDRVCGLIAGGGYAEYCCVHEHNTLPAPDHLELVQAAAIPETFMTVWTNLFQDGKLSANDRVLIHGGSSGIGTTAIQLARAFKAQQIIVTVGSQEKADACLELGATDAINYREQNFAKEVKQLTDGHGVDLILDMIGGDYVTQNYRAAAKYGRIVQIATQQGNSDNVEVFRLMLKRLTHTGSTLRSRTVEEKAAIARELNEKVWPLINEGEVGPVIDTIFDFSDARKAHELMDSSKHIGKIVLRVSEE
ncbi:NAD(P)H-quinone oxidoreductase [Carnimonas bestiolae]|uniref:NAD(P)H-quinone oxidoreductase n=1 Tax=Carnimonas bestiolae TaxID=3402172 RepID=UPI003EDBE72E